MIGIVVSGHIHFASGMQSALRAIVGEQDQMQFIDFEESMSTDQLKLALAKAAQEVNSGDGVLFLTDIPGGSPCNRAMEVMVESSDVELLAGVSLPMIINCAFEREDVTLSQLVKTLLEIGGSCMQDMRKQLALAMKDNREALCEVDGV